MNLKRIIREELEDFDWIKDEASWAWVKVNSCDELIEGDRIKITSKNYFVTFNNNVGEITKFNYNDLNSPRYTVKFDEEFSKDLHRDGNDDGMRSYYVFKCNRLTDGKDVVYVYKKTEDINESDFDWIEEIGDKLIIGQEYEIEAPNGRSWIPMVYCDEGTTTHPDTNELINGHRFSDIGSDKCNSWYSLGYIDELIGKGKLRPKKS